MVRLLVLCDYMHSTEKAESMLGWLTSPGETIEYRAYRIGSDSTFLSFSGRDCANDGAAIRWARELYDGRTIELWTGQRFISRFTKSTVPSTGRAS
jgi:hypothetical protein